MEAHGLNAKMMTTFELKTEMGKYLCLTVENLMRLAAIVCELERRGEDMSYIRMGLLPILRQIGNGELLPEIVVMYGGQPAVMKQIAKLNIEEQREIVQNRREPPRLPFRNSSKNGAQRELKESPASTATLRVTLKGIAEKGCPKDIGELAAMMIGACQERAVAVRAMVMHMKHFDLEVTSEIVDLFSRPPEKRQ